MRGDELGFVLVLRRAVRLVEDAELARERFVRELVGRVFIRRIVTFRDEVELATLARVGGVERAGEELDAFAQALDEAEAIMIHGGFHHLQHVIRVRVRGAGHERRAHGHRLLHRIDRAVLRTPDVRLGLEADRRRRGRLLLRQAVNLVVHDHVGHLDVLARRVREVVTTDGEGVTITTEDEHVQVRAAQGDTAGERQGAAMDEVRTVRLYEVGEAAGAADARHRRDLLMPHLALLDQFEIERENGEVTTAGAPRRVIGSDFFLGQALAIGIRDGRHRGGVQAARAGQRLERECKSFHMLA